MWRFTMPAASLTLALVLAATAARADDPTDDSAIRKALTDWTEAFNAGDAEQVCDLFAPDLISSFRGAPERGFAELCGQLRRSLADPDRTYRYSLDLKEILVSGDLAAVRLEWTLEVEDRTGAPVQTFQEPGLDVFHRQPDGSWKIARFLAFDATSP